MKVNELMQTRILRVHPCKCKKFHQNPKGPPLQIPLKFTKKPEGTPICDCVQVFSNSITLF